MRTNPTNRRGLLAGLALAPAAAVAAPALAQSDGADFEILELGRRHRVLAEEAAAASALADTLWSAAQEQMPSLPATLIARPDDWYVSLAFGEVGKPFPPEKVESWRKALATEEWRFLPNDRQARFQARGRELADAWDAHKAAREAVYVASGYRAADAAFDALDGELLRIERQIIGLKATTPAGWKVKARVVAATLDEPDGTYSDKALRSLLADLTA